jgi:hypothetical protein
VNPTQPSTPRTAPSTPPSLPFNPHHPPPPPRCNVQALHAASKGHSPPSPPLAPNPPNPPICTAVSRLVLASTLPPPSPSLSLPCLAPSPPSLDHTNTHTTLHLPSPHRLTLSLYHHPHNLALHHKGPCIPHKPRQPPLCPPLRSLPLPPSPPLIPPSPFHLFPPFTTSSLARSNTPLDPDLSVVAVAPTSPPSLIACSLLGHDVRTHALPPHPPPNTPFLHSPPLPAPPSTTPTLSARNPAQHCLPPRRLIAIYRRSSTDT